MTETCVSVSGRPDALAVFRGSYLPASTIQSRLSAIHTLYHSPELVGVKAQIMRDLRSRDVRFPNYSALRRTLRSTYTGDIIPATERNDGYTLAEEVVDMTMLHPVNFDRVVAGVRRDLQKSADSNPAVSLVNLGPGNVLWRNTASSLSDAHLTMLDWSSAACGELIPPSIPQEARRSHANAHEPVAIVGMAVKFPGATDVAGLWEVLEKGLNTVSEVRTALCITPDGS